MSLLLIFRPLAVVLMWFECSPSRQRWRTLTGPVLLWHTDWSKLRVCSQRGQLSTEVNWVADCSLWYRHNWKWSKPIHTHLQTCATACHKHTLLCEHAGNPMDFENTAVLRFPLCPSRFIYFVENRLEQLVFIEENEVCRDIVLH